MGTRVRLSFARLALLSAIAVAAPAGRAGAEPDRAAPQARYKRIHVVDFEGDIDRALEAYVKRSLAAAKADGADAVVLRIDSRGGEVGASMEIARAVLSLPTSIRTVAWVPTQAYSGASMAALACDEIVMGPFAKIGDCQPILMGPSGFLPAGEKIETVLRAEFRRYAEDNGWQPLLAEKLVSADTEVVVVRDREGRRLYVDGAELASARDDDLVGGVRKRELVRERVAAPKGRLLTMTTSEARDMGFVQRTFEKEADLLAEISAPDATVVRVGMSSSEHASRWLLGFVGILGALVILCAGITVFQGFGLASLVGIGALIVTGLVTVTADLPFGFPLFLVAVGLVLLAVEAFLLPGFGIAGILGIVSAATGFLSLSTGFTWSGSGTLTWAAGARFVGQFAATMLVGGAALVFLSRLFPSLPFANRHLLLRAGALSTGAAVLPGDVLPAIGTEGSAATDLRPAGRATLSGRGYDVTSDGDFVEAGTPVRVLRVEGSRVVVRAAPVPLREDPRAGAPS